MGKDYRKWIGTDGLDSHNGELEQAALLVSRQEEFSSNLIIRSPRQHFIQNGPGFFLGFPSGPGYSSYLAISQGAEGNIVVVGGNGSGKSSGIAKPTLRTWSDAICATDIKGELSDFYSELYEQGLVTRPYIVFDPMQANGPSYDPFWWLSEDAEANLLNNIWEITFAVFPTLPNDNQPFWVETERGVCAAALLHYYTLGLSFSESVCQIEGKTVSSLCEELKESNDIRVTMLLGQAADMKEETLASVDRGLRNKLVLFAADPYIGHALRGAREGAKCFSWNDLDKYNIFLRIPADKIEQWGGVVTLMYTQLIHHLERRPEQYSEEGTKLPQVLLLMDEFARFGKLEMITSALATLRSKKVNICLMVQSVAQLDKIYGEHDRQIIFDNCQFQVILRANDADTQKYLCELIGSRICGRHSKSVHINGDLCVTGFSEQVSEVRDLCVQPHELATLDDVLLLSPCGFNRVKKFSCYNRNTKSVLFGTSKVIRAKPIPIGNAEDAEEIISNDSKRNEGAKMLSIEERTANAGERVQAAEQQRRRTQRAGREAQERQDRHRNYIVGELVTKYFPDVLNYEAGTKEGNITRFEPLEAFLYVLSTDDDLVRELQERAARLVSENPDGEWRLPM